MNAKLIRLFASDNSGIFGELYFEDKRFCFTKERLWLNNQRHISCIPDGEYICTKIVSTEFGKTFMVMDVPDRSEILFHWGSYVDNSKGCILIGTAIELIDPDGEILLRNTRTTHKYMMSKLINTDTFKLEIASPWDLTI